jgi:hypothetical protein
MCLRREFFCLPTDPFLRLSSGCFWQDAAQYAVQFALLLTEHFPLEKHLEKIVNAMCEFLAKYGQ